MKNYIIILMCFIVTSCGTVSHIPMTPQNRSTLKDVTVNNNIKLPPKMYFLGSTGAKAGMLFGVVGGVVGGLKDQQHADKIEEMLNPNHIDIKQIIANQWQRQLASKFKMSNNSDNVLITDVVLYGLSIPNGLSSEYIPVLTINAKLVNHNKVLWQMSDRIFEFTANTLPHYKIDEIESDPEKLRQMWTFAAQKAVSEMIHDMNKA